MRTVLIVHRVCAAKPETQQHIVNSKEEACDHTDPLSELMKCQKCRVGATHRNDPPVAQLTGGIGQDEHGKPEDSQQLQETVGRMEEKGV